MSRHSWQPPDIEECITKLSPLIGNCKFDHVQIEWVAKEGSHKLALAEAVEIAETMRATRLDIHKLLLNGKAPKRCRLLNTLAKKEKR